MENGDQFALGLEERGTLTSGSGLSGGVDEQGHSRARHNSSAGTDVG